MMSQHVTTDVYSCTGDYLHEVETNSPALFHYEISKREMAALELLDVNVKYHLVKNWGKKNIVPSILLGIIPVQTVKGCFWQHNRKSKWELSN